MSLPYFSFHIHTIRVATILLSLSILCIPTSKLLLLRQFSYSTTHYTPYLYHCSTSYTPIYVLAIQLLYYFSHLLTWTLSLILYFKNILSCLLTQLHSWQCTYLLTSAINRLLTYLHNCFFPYFSNLSATYFYTCHFFLRPSFHPPHFSTYRHALWHDISQSNIHISSLTYWHTA